MADTLTARGAPAPAPAGPSTVAFDAIGTRWCVDTDEPLGGEVRDRILDRIRRFDRAYSRFRRTRSSPRSPPPRRGRFEFPEDSVALFDLYDRLVTATDGAVGPLVGRQLELLGYDPTYSTPPPDAVRDREPLGHGRPGRRTSSATAPLITRRPLVLDVGAAGKGYLVDIISAILQHAGVARFVVDAGGDLRHRGEHGIRVEHPLDPRLVIGVANLQDGALCASAVNRRAWSNGLPRPRRPNGRTGHRGRGHLGRRRRRRARRRPGRRCSLPARTGRRPAGSPTCGCSPTAAPNARPTSTASSSHDRTAQNDPGHDDHRDLRRRGHRRMRDDGHDGTTASSAPNTSVAAPGSPSSRRSKYADGTYTATGQYGSLPQASPCPSPSSMM